MSETALSSAITWALEHGWLEANIPLAVIDRYIETLTDEQIGTVIDVAQARIALELSASPAEGV